MRLERLTPMLRTWDLSATIKFYEQTLGFACVERSDEWGWASLQRDGVAIMLAPPNKHEGDEAPAFTGSLYFRVDDVDGWWERVKDQARVAYPIENFEYGMREFAVYDDNGYMLQFGTELS